MWVNSHQMSIAWCLTRKGMKNSVVLDVEMFDQNGADHVESNMELMKWRINNQC